MPYFIKGDKKNNLEYNDMRFMAEQLFTTKIMKNMIRSHSDKHRKTKDRKDIRIKAWFLLHVKSKDI